MLKLGGRYIIVEKRPETAVILIEMNEKETFDHVCRHKEVSPQGFLGQFLQRTRTLSLAQTLQHLLSQPWE